MLPRNDEMPSADELKRLAAWACPEWVSAMHAGRLRMAGDLPNGTPFIGISGNRAVRDGFIRDQECLGCKNRNPDHSASYCCTFAVVALSAESGVRE